MSDKIKVRAVQFAGLNPFPAIEELVGGDAEGRNGQLVVATRDGALHASQGDWIVEIAPHKFITISDADFAKTYEASRG